MLCPSELPLSQRVGSGAKVAVGGVRGHTRRRQHPLGLGAQVVQAGPDVLAVVVALLLVEAGLGVQALERGPELHQLRPPPLPVPALVADVLGVGDRGRGCWPFLAGEPPGLTQAQEPHSPDLQEEQEEEDFKATFPERGTISRMPPQTFRGRLQDLPH